MTTPILPLILALLILGIVLALLKPYVEPTVFQVILVLLVAAVALYVLLPLFGKVKLFSQSISLDTSHQLPSTNRFVARQIASISGPFCVNRFVRQSL